MNAMLKLVTPEIRQIPYWEVESVWERVSHLLQKAIDVQDEWTLEGVKQALMVANSTSQLWVIGDTGAIVTTILRYQTGVNKCLLFLGGGSAMNESLNTHAQIEEWAKRWHNCHKMIIHGRRGWKKVLSGYEETTTCLEKVL